MGDRKPKKQNFVNMIKKGIKRPFQRGRKKGAVLIEFILAVPVFMLLLWGIMNIILYLIAASNLNEAAYEASRALAKEMRGQEGAILENHTDDIPRQVELVTGQTNFILFGKPGHIAVYDYEESVMTSPVSVTTCEDTKNNENIKNYLCAYVVSFTSSNGRQLEQIVVEMKSEFNMIGNMIPGLQKIMPLNAKAVAQKELPGRYDYVE